MPLARAQPEPPAEEDRSYVAFPSAGLRLRQPEGFQRASRFDGFEQPSTQSSVMISVIPGPYAKLTEGFSSPTLMSSRKMSVESRSPIDIGGLRGELVDLTQSLPTGAIFRKWIAVFGDDSETTMITAAFPEEHGEDLSERLKATVLSAKLDAGSPSRSPADVGFEIAASGKMKRAGAVGKSLLFTKDGVMPVKEPTDPLFVAAVGTAAVSDHDHEEFARQRLEATADTQIQSVTSEVKVEIDGLEGIELKADAEDTKSGTPMRVYQVVLFEGGSYFLMQGLVGAELGEEYLGEFEAMAHSLSRKQSAHAERAAAIRRQMKDARRRFRQPLESATDGEPDFGERQASAMDLDPIAESLDAPQQPIAQLSYQRSDVKSTEVVGSSHAGQYFAVAAPEGGVLVGLRVICGENWGGAVSAVEPIFQVANRYESAGPQGDAGLEAYTLLAPPGFAVGCVQVRAGLVMNALRLVYMPISGNRMNLQEVKYSDWVGSEGGGPDQLIGDGSLVVGVSGWYQEDILGLKLAYVGPKQVTIVAEPATNEASNVRTWTSATGKFQMEAKLVSFDGQEVTLERKDGTKIKLSTADVSAEDQAWLKERSKEK